MHYFLCVVKATNNELSEKVQIKQSMRGTKKEIKTPGTYNTREL